MARLFERSMGVPGALEALQVRHGLLDRLSRIQRSISHGAPLEDVFSAIAAGAAELLGDPIAGLRLIDEDDPTTMVLVASVGLTPEQLDQVRHGAVGEGAGGRAIVEGGVVVVEDYPDTSDGIARFGEFGVRNALAAPIRVNGQVVGSLTVASFETGRRYDLVEQEILSALAEHAGLALLDATLIGERERQVERQGEERFHALIRHSSDLIAIVDEEGAISFATPSVGRVLGVSPEALLDSTLLAHVHPADRPRAGSLLRAAAGRQGTLPPADWRLVPAGAQFQPQRWMHVEVLATNLLEHPSIRGIVLNARDVTERMLAEQQRREQDARLAAQLHQAQELEMLGRLAGHVAHDFNQVLAVISGYANLLRERPVDARTREDVMRIVEASEHGAALARQLLTFSRRDGGDPEVLDLGEVTLATVRLVESTAPAGVSVQARTAAEPLPVRIDPTKLRQVLMNLVDNAFDALAEGGELVLATAEVTVGEGDGPPPGRYARLRVSDTGAGMPPDVVARALEPAYTTKPSGRGTGLGLSIVHGAVKSAGGHVTLRSEAGAGTVVEILLPSAPDTPEPTDDGGSPAPGEASPASGPATATILLVEDDVSVLELTRRVLAENGYEVLTATGGTAALAAAADRSIDLLLTDQTLPGGSGLELARQLAERRPDTPAIVMSGYAAEVAANRPSGVAWLHKPFGADALLSAVRGALEQP